MATLYGNDSNPIIEALIGGVWTDISSRVRGDQKCVIRRGRASEQARTTAQRLNLTLDNPDAFFSNRAPLSVNYGLIGKNIQIRVRAGGDTDDRYLKLPFGNLDSALGATTTDKAVLDITGDIDIRAEIWPRSWRGANGMIIASKYLLTSDQRSWFFAFNNEGKLTLYWTSAGTFATRRVVTSTDAVPATSGKLAVRVTLDVNNGAGGVTANFYTSTSIGGSWTSLGSAVVSAGTTSIHSGSARLGIGRGDNSRNANTSGFLGFGGDIYGVEVRNGISGTLVADFDATTQDIGATSWSDGLGTPNTWTVEGVSDGARVTTDRIRFWGELTNLPQRWDKTGTDVTIPAQAYGMLRRLSQGAKPLDSSMVRNFRRYSPYAWWPLEDGALATSAASGVSGGRAALLTACSPGTSSDLPGASQVLSFTGSTSQFAGTVPVLPANTGVASATFYVRLTTLPAAKRIFAYLNTSGTVRRIEVGLDSSNWYTDFYAADGTLLASNSTGFSVGNPTETWVGYNVSLTQNGSAVDWRINWDLVGGVGLGIGPLSIASATVQPFNSVRFLSFTEPLYNDLRLAHVYLSTSDTDIRTAKFRDASNAYFGETAGERTVRLAAEEGVLLEIQGSATETEAMGFQSTKTFVDLLYECWEADGGIGAEARDALLLTYRTRVDLENRSDLEISYPANQMSEVPEPDDGDQGLLNDVTVRRQGGSQARVQITEGPNSINSPTDSPPGVGVYDTDRTLNVAYDDRLPSIAGWMALVGAWDADRYPLIAFAMHRSQILSDTALFTAIIRVDLGSTVVLTEMPSWMNPDDVPELVQGYTETLGKFLWDVRYDCTPAGPYSSTALLDAVEVDGRTPRLDATSHSIGAGINTTATSLSLVTPAGSARWVDSATYPADFPMEIVIGGEVMELTAVTGTSSPQTGTVSRSVNGIVKSHLSGALVRLARPYFIGR